jgi:hypothetical protein
MDRQSFFPLRAFYSFSSLYPSRKVAGSSPDNIIEFFQFTQSFQLHHGPEVYSDSNRNEYQKIFLGCKTRPARKADNLTAICEPII